MCYGFNIIVLPKSDFGKNRILTIYIYIYFAGLIIILEIKTRHLML